MVLVNHPVDSAVRTREYRKHVLYNNNKNNDGSGGGGGGGDCDGDDGAACELLHACKWIARKAGARSSAVYISLLCVLYCYTEYIFTVAACVFHVGYRCGSTVLKLMPSSSQSAKDIDGITSGHVRRKFNRIESMKSELKYGEMKRCNDKCSINK